jgi:hypothetical protein
VSVESFSVRRRCAIEGACLCPKRFSTVRREVGDDKRHGRLVTTKTDENVEKGGREGECCCGNGSLFRHSE